MSMSSISMAKFAITCLLSMSATLAMAADPVPDMKHLGVATCATSTCHGKISAQPDKNVALNEYRTWLQEDRHAQAYRTLESAASKAIAAKLGLANATSAKICLDCHADNVPATKRGPKFQISDGIACEACHGGAEKWLESHAATNATHKANIALGMYPTENALSRANLCLSCHLGTRDRFATHTIMGAGHPRLSFELEAFTANQPGHYVVDADYIQRKGKPEGIVLWLTGQFENARRFLTLLQVEMAKPAGMFPELAFYDCRSCHHPMSQKNWTRERVGPGVAVGSVRLQTQNLLTLQAVDEVLSGNSGTLPAARLALVRAGANNSAAVTAASQDLLKWLTTQEAWLRRPFSRDDIAKIRKTLVSYAAADKASDYAAAEQIVLGVESLSYSLGDRDKLKGALDKLYQAVRSETDFNPGQFMTAAQGIQKQF